VKNSVVHGSEAWSLYVSSSKNILIESSDFIGSKSVGINLNSISNV
jgi:nitrous oxidase accessory protein NosD